MNHTACVLWLTFHMISTNTIACIDQGNSILKRNDKNVHVKIKAGGQGYGDNSYDIF